MAEQKSVPLTPNKREELALRNWREQPVAPLDTPELRKRIGKIIGEHAGKQQSFTPDLPKKK
jgi:hypothetical protein